MMRQGREFDLQTRRACYPIDDGIPIMLPEERRAMLIEAMLCRAFGDGIGEGR